jgi:hypothetical protein
MTIRSDFSDSFSTQSFGRITGTFAMSQFPNQPAYLARFKAYGDNGGTIWLGNMRTSGTFPFCWPLAPGDDTGWFSVPLDDTADSQGNLSIFWQNASSGSCYLAYWIQR